MSTTDEQKLGDAKSPTMAEKDNDGTTSGVFIVDQDFDLSTVKFKAFISDQSLIHKRPGKSYLLGVMYTSRDSTRIVNPHQEDWKKTGDIVRMVFKDTKGKHKITALWHDRSDVIENMVAIETESGSWYETESGSWYKVAKPTV